MSGMKKKVAWGVAIVLCYFVLPFGLGFAGVHMVQSDQPLLSSPAFDLFIYCVAVLPGVVLPWFGSFRWAMRLALSIAALAWFLY